jgi:pilus assembly protein CpaE
VLTAPAAPESSQAITKAHVEQILSTLLDGYDMVVIDAGSTLDERVLTMFEAAETVLLTVTPEIGALKSMHGLLENLAEAGTISLKSRFVLNNLFARDILKVRDVETFLGSKMAVELPYDPFLYLKAVNEGVPIVLGAPRSPAAERLVRLSSTAFGADGIVVPSQGEERKSGSRFSLRRR